VEHGVCIPSDRANERESTFVWSLGLMEVVDLP
jgi:hypothetical protein